MRQLASASLGAAVQSRLASTSSAPGLTGPAVKLILQQYGLDARAIPSSGPKNNLLKSDVLSYITKERLSAKPIKVSPPAQPKEQPKPAAAALRTGHASTGAFVDIPLSSMRSTIAKRLSASKNSIPHTYLAAPIPADNILKLRKVLVKDGIKVSVNDFVIKAVALALRSVPTVNVQYKNDTIYPMQTVDVSVAVATPNGLITPIIFGADNLGVASISQNLRELADRARQNKLKLNEFQGGTFTISNLGMFGVSHFTAIINPPQTAILAVGGVQTELNEELKAESRFTVTLCYDGRAIDESDAQRFLANLQSLLGTPETMVSGAIEETFDLAALL